MTSEIRVNKLTNRIGLSTVTFADSGIGVTVTGRIDPDTDSARDLGTTSVRWRNAYVDTYYGDGSNLTGITGTTINNNADNRIITGSGTANTLEGESNFTWTGSALQVTAGTGNQFPFNLRNDFTPNSQRSDLLYAFNGTSNNVLRIGSINSNGGITIQSTRANDSSIKHDLLLQPDGGNVGVNYNSTQNWGAKFRVGGLLLSDQGAGNPYVFGKLSSAQDFVIGRSDVSGTLTEYLHIFANGNVEVTNKLTFAGDGHTKGIELGADGDVVLYHDNNDAYFDNNKGDFYIRNDGNSTTEALRFQAKGNQNSIVSVPNGGTSIYFNGSRKFFTQNLGCTVESTGNTPELTFRGASNLDMGKIDVDQFATNYSMMRFFTLTNGTETEYARILDNGNFCVGGMIGSSNNNNIQSPGQGNGNTNIGSAMHVSGRFICNSTSSFSSFGRNSTGLVVSFTRQGGDQGGITVGVGYVTYGSGSDYRLKENVAPLTDAITRIKQLEPKRFNFIQDTTDTLRDGFLAHEVSSIVPEAITGTKDEVDSDNNPVYQQIDQAKLVPLLTASIQELITKVETLEQENIALRARVTNLEGN